MSSIPNPPYPDRPGHPDKPLRVVLQEAGPVRPLGQAASRGFCSSSPSSCALSLPRIVRTIHPEPIRGWRNGTFRIRKPRRRRWPSSPIEGAIMHSDGFAKWQIDQVRKDPDVKAVVVRVDSPGGTVTGSDYLYHHLRQAARRATRFRWWSAWEASRPAAATTCRWPRATRPTPFSPSRTTWTGSIGVIIPHYNIADLLESWKIKDDSIASGPFKELGSPTRKLTPAMAEQERKILQTTGRSNIRPVQGSGDRSAGRSWPTIKTRSPRPPPARCLPPSRRWNWDWSIRLGFQEDAVDRAIELAGLDKKNVRVVKYVRPKACSVRHCSAPKSQSQSFTPSALLDLNTPRAYFLYTMLPAR